MTESELAAMLSDGRAKVGSQCFGVGAHGYVVEIMPPKTRGQEIAEQHLRWEHPATTITSRRIRLAAAVDAAIAEECVRCVKPVTIDNESARCIADAIMNAPIIREHVVAG